MNENIEDKIKELNEKFLKLAAKHQKMADICVKAAKTEDEEEIFKLTTEYLELKMSSQN